MRKPRDPLAGLPPELIELVGEAKKEQQAAWKADDVALAHRAKVQAICLELRKRGLGTNKIARVLDVSAAYIYQITREE
jgi:hypothetical protein